MAKEEQPPPAEGVQAAGVQVKGLLIDLEHASVTVLADTEILCKVSLSPSGVIFESPAAPSNETAPIIRPSESPAEVPATAESVEPSPEKAKPVTLTGRLKSKPREGRPDAQGKPTAWARFAASDEDREGAHMFSTTFHKHTAKVALGLDPNASITVQGYPHEHQDQDKKRMDTLSVINLVDYPGKEK